MREEDARRAAVAVRRNIEQLLDAGTGKHAVRTFANEARVLDPDSLNVCENTVLPHRGMDPHFAPLLEQVVLLTPRPALENGLGELPRFRAELGMFLGFSPALRGSMLTSGHGMDQKTAGSSGGIEASVRLGLGLDGLLNEAGDGLVFLDLGWRQDGSSTGDRASFLSGDTGGISSTRVPSVQTLFDGPEFGGVDSDLCCY